MSKAFQAVVYFSILTILALPALANEEYKWGIQQDWFDSIKNTLPSSNSYLFAKDDTGDSDDVATSVGIAAAEEVEEKKTGGYTDEEIAEMINNPLGNLWLLFTQNDTVWYSGDVLDKINEDDKIFNTLLINPVLPMQLTENWKYIFRPVIPINSFDLPSGLTVNQPGDPPTGVPGINVDFERETGLGDIVLWNAFSTNEGAKPPNVWGAGVTIMMDTATDERLGTGKWSAGPMALAMRITDKWIYGGILQHYWSFAGDSDRDNVNLSDLQYILRYRLTPETNIGFGPNIRYNWNAESGDKLSLPVGLGADTMINIGPLPVKIGLEAYYYVESPDAFGPEWQIRFLFVPVIPSPAWSKSAIFGK